MNEIETQRRELQPINTLKDFEENHNWNHRDKVIIKMWIDTAFKEGVSLAQKELLKEFMIFCENGFRATGELEMQKKANELYNRIEKLGEKGK